MFVPQSMSSVFNSMRQKFGMTFSKIRDTMKEASTNIKTLKPSSEIVIFTSVLS